MDWEWIPRKNRDTGELCMYKVVSATMDEEWLTKLEYSTDLLLLGEWWQALLTVLRLRLYFREMTDRRSLVSFSSQPRFSPPSLVGPLASLLGAPLTPFPYSIRLLPFFARWPRKHRLRVPFAVGAPQLYFRQTAGRSTKGKAGVSIAVNVAE